MNAAKVLLGWMLISVVVASPASTKEVANERSFSTIQVYLDSGPEPLAAYQMTLKLGHSDSRLVGVEGGTNPAFSEAPYYDPRALRGGEIKLAAMQLADALPMHRIHVATLHVEHDADNVPRLAASEIVAATRSGRTATVKFSYETGDRP